MIRNRIYSDEFYEKLEKDMISAKIKIQELNAISSNNRSYNPPSLPPIHSFAPYVGNNEYKPINGTTIVNNNSDEVCCTKTIKLPDDCSSTLCTYRITNAEPNSTCLQLPKKKRKLTNE